jgi:hypothetical protein
VQHNTVQRNGDTGIEVFVGIVAHNVADNNERGISLARGSASHNGVMRNGVGLSLTSETNYIGNVLVDNLTNVTGGRNQGQNLCGNSVCPGAQF